MTSQGYAYDDAGVKYIEMHAMEKSSTASHSYKLSMG